MRASCYSCFRPLALCLCGTLPSVPNRTEVVILQHPRERTHPFGSARMLAQGLQRSQLHVASRGGGKSVYHPLALGERAALLYPGRDSRLLSSLAPDERPEQLVLLDGTWSQAHRLFKDNPWLLELPQVGLLPERASRYLVRKEPKPHCLSTLEAAVLALGALEGEVPGLADLLEVFERMNVQQVALRRAAYGSPRRKRTRTRASRVVPEGLLGDDRQLVVMYGESTELATRADPKQREILHWTAMRLGTGEVFQVFVQPSHGAPSAAHLRRVGLPPTAFAAATLQADFVTSLQAFLRPQDVLCAWNQSTFRLLPQALLEACSLVQLKAVYCNWRGGHCGTLDDVVQREQVDLPQLPVAGRAQQRLSHAVALTRLLTLQG